MANKIDRGTQTLLDDLRGKPPSVARSLLIKRAQQFKYHDYKADDATPELLLRRHLQQAGYHDLVANVEQGKYAQQSDAREEWEKTPEGQEAVRITRDPAIQKSLDAFMGMVVETEKKLGPEGVTKLADETAEKLYGPANRDPRNN